MRNYYVVQGDVTAIKVESKKHGIHWVIIDTNDLEIMPKGKIGVQWNKDTQSFYATYCNCKTVQKLHRLILGFPEGLEIDHKNHDTLNNRRKNLTSVTRQKNQHNRRDKGYCWNKVVQKWRARIALNGKSIHLGFFEHEQDARNQYLLAKEIIHVI